MSTYDLVVVGGGTGGLVGSLIAAGVGARVALVESGRTGGDCLWTGCVPSKALIAAAELAQRMRDAADVGLEPVAPAIDFARVMDRVRGAQAAIEPHDSPERLRREGVEVIEGRARFDGPDRVRVEGRVLRFRRALVATGSRPVLPAVPGIEEAAPLTNETVWDLRELPGRLVVLGGGPIGCELGQAFARLGSRVTIVEAEERLLTKEEPAASAVVRAALEREGVAVITGARVATAAPGELRIGGERLAFDALLVAAGRRPVTDGLGLDAAGVRTDGRGAIVVDDRLRTTAKRIWAAGDVTGRLPFTHVAAQHARVAVPNALFGLRRRADSAAVPWVTFTDPEVARAGLTEGQARERWGAGATVASFDYAGLDRAITAGRASGFAKLVGDRRGRLVGATVAGPAAGESIAELAAWIGTGARIDRVSRAVHAYPTFAEGAARAADEHVRRRLLGPRVRRPARAVLALARAVDRLT